MNKKLQFLCRQNEFLNPKLRRLLCNSLIQPHFGYASIFWYPLINQKIRNKLQVTQNECIHFWLKFNSRQHVSLSISAIYFRIDNYKHFQSCESIV